MLVHLLDYRTGKRQVMATLELVDGEIIQSGKVPPSVQDTLDEVEADSDSPEAMLARLPLIFSSPYLRAQLVR